MRYARATDDFEAGPTAAASSEPFGAATSEGDVPPPEPRWGSRGAKMGVGALAAVCMFVGIHHVASTKISGAGANIARLTTLDQENGVIVTAQNATEGPARPPPVVFTSVAGMVPYLTYEGTLLVDGLVDIVERLPGIQTITWTLSGVDPACANGTTGRPNSCGLHIHEGTSCSEDAGFHYWNRTAAAVDPWRNFIYEEGSGFGNIATGLPIADLENRTFIIHDSNGSRVACGIVRSSSAGQRAQLAAAVLAAIVVSRIFGAW